MDTQNPFIFSSVCPPASNASLARSYTPLVLDVRRQVLFNEGQTLLAD